MTDKIPSCVNVTFSLTTHRLTGTWSGSIPRLLSTEQGKTWTWQTSSHRFSGVVQLDHMVLLFLALVCWGAYMVTKLIRIPRNNVSRYVFPHILTSMLFLHSLSLFVFLSLSLSLSLCVHFPPVHTKLTDHQLPSPWDYSHVHYLRGKGFSHWAIPPAPYRSFTESRLDWDELDSQCRFGLHPWRLCHLLRSSWSFCLLG